MDIYHQWHLARQTADRRPRRTWSRAEKALIVLETYRPSSTVSGVAREHGIPASLLFEWRKLHREGVFSACTAFEARSASPQST